MRMSSMRRAGLAATLAVAAAAILPTVGTAQSESTA